MLQPVLFPVVVPCTTGSFDEVTSMISIGLLHYRAGDKRKSEQAAAATVTAVAGRISLTVRYCRP